MCETLPWFRSFHAGVYQKGGIAKGYMLSGFGAAWVASQFNGLSLTLSITAEIALNTGGN